MGVPLPKIIQYLENIAPCGLAQDWDKVGLQVGDEQAQITCSLLALDILPATVTYAQEINAELIIAHHPLIFNPLNNLIWQEPSSLLLKQIIKANLNIFVAHTNFDSSEIGSSNLLADMLGLIDRQTILPVREKVYKLVVFVPPDYAEPLRLALGKAGAGVIGDYSSCVFQTSGQGFFNASRQAAPFIGKAGEMNEVAELRLETIVTKDVLSQVLQALKAIHPYQEPAYDIYPLYNSADKTGLGVIGSLPGMRYLVDLAEELKNNLGLSGLRWVGSARQEIERVAVCGGSGGDSIDEARKAGAQLLISGDFKYHQARRAQMLGLALLDIGHFTCEFLAMQKLAGKLNDWINIEKLGMKVVFHQGETDPFNYLTEGKESEC